MLAGPALSGKLLCPVSVALFHVVESLGELRMPDGQVVVRAGSAAAALNTSAAVRFLGPAALVRQKALRDVVKEAMAAGTDPQVSSKGSALQRQHPGIRVVR
jgi:hypothetical protein